MEAGLLAIAGGKAIQLVADNTQKNKEDGALASNPFREMMQQASAMQQQMNSAEAANDDVADAAIMQALSLAGVDVQELADVLSDEQWQQLQASGGLMLISGLAASGSLPQGAAPDDALEQVMWQLTDSQTGSIILGDDAPEGITLLTLQGDEGAILALSPDALASQEDMEALREWVAQLKELHETALPEDAAVGAVVPLVSFMAAPVQGWNNALRAGNGVQVQIVEAASSGDALTTKMGQAIAADDVSILSDAELAKLDALIDRIAQKSTKSDGPLGEFRASLAEQLTAMRPETLPANQTSHESVQPSVLSASHASQQTRPDDASQFRVLQAGPTFNAPANDPTEQVKVTIQQAMRAGMDRVQIQLDPADLGRVDVRLDLASDGRAQILIQADNRDTLDMLQRDARLLERALQEAGIDANAQDMTFNLNDGEQQTGTNDAEVLSNEEVIEAMTQPELTLDPLSGSYTLSIAQGLDIKV
jgi:hypothetical protein